MGEHDDVEVGPGRERGNDAARARRQDVLLLLGLLRPLQLAVPPQVAHRPLVPLRRPVATLGEDQQRLVVDQGQRQLPHRLDPVVSGSRARRQEVAVETVQQQVDARVPLQRLLEHDLRPAFERRQQQVDQRERVTRPGVPTEHEQRAGRRRQGAGVHDDAEAQHRPRRHREHLERLTQQGGVTFPPHRHVARRERLAQPQHPATEDHAHIGPQVCQGERHRAQQPAGAGPDRQNQANDVERQEQSGQEDRGRQPQRVTDPAYRHRGHPQVHGRLTTQPTPPTPPTPPTQPLQPTQPRPRTGTPRSPPPRPRCDR